MKMILFYSNIHSFATNKFEIVVNGISLQQNLHELPRLKQSLNCYHVIPIRLMLVMFSYYKNRSLLSLKNII